MPALRQTSGTGVPPSAYFRTKAICASVSFDAFMELSLSPTGDHKWKNASSEWSQKPGAASATPRAISSGSNPKAPSFPGGY